MIDFTCSLKLYINLQQRKRRKNQNNMKTNNKTCLHWIPSEFRLILEAPSESHTFLSHHGYVGKEDTIQSFE